jgi:signal transduction histidine kinase
MSWWPTSERPYWHEYWSTLSEVNLRRSFTPHDQRIAFPSNPELAEIMTRMGKLASMGQLAAGIAHEVDNPLGTLLMLSHTLLEEAPAQSPMREDLALMASEAGRCRDPKSYRVISPQTRPLHASATTP